MLDAAGAPIPGLYACGNDAQSVMGSEYPGAGCQVGAGLTFGYVAARHAAAPDVSGDATEPSNRPWSVDRPEGDREPLPDPLGRDHGRPDHRRPHRPGEVPDGITALFAERGVNAVVVPLQVAAADLDALLTGLTPSASVSGLIATVPHKFGLAAHCATLTDRARFLGSVNVARRNPDGTWHGDQVDGAAFVAALPANPEGATALQVGAGGAGSAIALALLEAGVAQLRLHDADPARRDAPGRTAAGALRRPRAGGRARPGPASTSSPTPPRWACGPATPTRSTSPG